MNSTTRYSIHALPKEEDDTNTESATSQLHAKQPTPIDTIPHILVFQVTPSDSSENHATCPLSSTDLRNITDPSQINPQLQGTLRDSIAKDPTSAALSLIQTLQENKSIANKRQAQTYIASQNLVVELLLVNDYERWIEYGDKDLIETSSLEIANLASAIYTRSTLLSAPYKIQITVVGIYTQTQPFWLPSSTPAVDVDRLLTTFCDWRANQRLSNQGTFLANNDVAHLLTSRTLTSASMNGSNSIEGYAFLSGVCNQRRGCGIVKAKRQPNQAYIGSTLAHELGHGLGMQHDGNVGCAASGFIMQASSCAMCANIASQWSSCSYSQLNTYLLQGLGNCLESTPQLCGNGIIDAGEECDAGPVATSCCSSTCKLLPNAQCEDKNGTCCQNCQFRLKGTPCRSMSSDPQLRTCDLADTCSGISGTCDNNIKVNGTVCAFQISNNPAVLQGTCNRGVCQSKQGMCLGLGYSYSDGCASQLGDESCHVKCTSNTGDCLSFRYASNSPVLVPDFVPCTLSGGVKGFCITGKCSNDPNLIGASSNDTTTPNSGVMLLHHKSEHWILQLSFPIIMTLLLSFVV